VSVGRQRGVSGRGHGIGMNRAQTDTLIRHLIGGNPAAAADLLDRAPTSADPLLLAAAALVDPAPSTLLDRANTVATTTRERQLLALVAAHLAGAADRVDALARDHLADHPDDLLVAWIATLSHLPANPDLARKPTLTQEMS
jgi:hypothetical protein